MKKGKVYIKDIYYRILADLPLTPEFIRRNFKEEWKKLEKRLENEKEM